MENLKSLSELSEHYDMPKIEFHLKDNEIIAKCDWDKGVNNQNFGIMLSLLASGKLNKFIEQAVVDKAHEDQDDNTGNSILEQYYGCNMELGKIDKKNASKRKRRTIIYEFLDVNNELNYEESEEDEDDDNEIYGVAGFPGFISKSQLDKIMETLKKQVVKFPERETWVGFTNFELSDNIWFYMSEVEGIEFCDRVGRYTFIFSMGRAFDFEQVRKNLEKVIKKYE